MVNIIKSQISNIVKNKYNQNIDLDSIPHSFTKPEIKGDFTLTLFPIAKLLGINPAQLTGTLAEELDLSGTEFESVSAQGGFINLTCNPSYWYHKVSVLDIHDFSEFGIPPEVIIVEYASPNTNKPIHLGHVRNILLGQSTASILELLGHKIIRTQVINDRGIAICKSMLAYKKFHNGQTPQLAGIKGDHFVGDMYVLFETKFKEEYKLWQNSQIASELLSAQKKENENDVEFFQRFKNQYFNEYSELGLEARKTLNDWESGEEQTIALWKQMNEWVYAGFEETYKNLGAHFDINYYESETYLPGKAAIENGLKSGIFEREGDGSVWIDLTSSGLDRKILLRSDGTSVYITQDIGLALERHNKYKFNRSIYVVADEQNYHFQTLFATLKTMGAGFSDHLYHLSYGMVELPTGRMKSREGTVVDADDLMSEVINEAKQSGEERGELSFISQIQQDEIYRKIGMAAIKFHMIKVEAKKRMIFNPAESVDMQGQTGPYIQNAYVRIRSILRKSGLNEVVFNSGNLEVLHEQETALIKILDQYKECIVQAGKLYEPSLLANYLYHLARNFHRYYHDVPVLTEPIEEIKNFRLAFISKIGETLKHGFEILGIEMPERM